MKKDNKYKLAVFEDEDKADLVEYSKQMQKSIEKALDENQGEKGEKGDKGDKGDKGELVDLVKEEEGKNISIESANLPAIEVSIEGESQQAASPSPDNLSKIENLEGKNKVKEINWKQMPSISTGATVTNVNGYGTDYIDVDNTKQYIFSYLGTSGSKYIVYYDKDKNFLGYDTEIQINNFAKWNETGYVRLRVDCSQDSVTAFQLEEGTVATDYVPYNSLEIKDVGKNLYAGNEITINGTYSSNTSVNLGSRYLSKGTYTISLTNSLPNNSYIYLGANGSIATAIRNKATFTLTEEQNVPMRLIVKAGTYGNFTTKIMIEKGMVVTDYEPHQQQTECFPLSEGQKLMKGSYLADDGIQHKRKQVIFTGNEDWILTSTNNQVLTKRFSGRISHPMKMNSQENALCTHFVNVNNVVEDIESIYYAPLGPVTYVALRINVNKATTVEELKTYLATQYANGTPVIVEYELAEEEIVPYTEEQKAAWEKIKNMILYKGTNHISCTGKLKIKYYTNEEMNEIYAKKEDLHEHANKSILDQTQEAFTTELKNKLDGLNNYVLPAPTSTTLGGVKAGANITIDTDGTINAQLGSSGETSANDYEGLSNKPQIAGITLQGNKSLADLGIQGVETGKGLSSNDYTTKEKAKLAGVEAQANKYIHPNTSGNKHVPSGGSSGQVLKWQSDGTAKWDSLSSSGELGTDNLNTKKISGIYAQSTATNFLKSRNYPFDHADGFPFFDILLEVKNAGMYIMQELHLSYKISVQGQEVISYFTYMRFSTNNGSTWSAWRGHEGTTTQ